MEKFLFSSRELFRIPAHPGIELLRNISDSQYLMVQNLFPFCTFNINCLFALGPFHLFGYHRPPGVYSIRLAGWLRHRQLISGSSSMINERGRHPTTRWVESGEGEYIGIPLLFKLTYPSRVYSDNNSTIDIINTITIHPMDGGTPVSHPFGVLISHSQVKQNSILVSKYNNYYVAPKMRMVMVKDMKSHSRLHANIYTANGLHPIRSLEQESSFKSSFYECNK